MAGNMLCAGGSTRPCQRSDLLLADSGAQLAAFCSAAYISSAHRELLPAAPGGTGVDHGGVDHNDLIVANAKYTSGGALCKSESADGNPTVSGKYAMDSIPGTAGVPICDDVQAETATACCAAALTSSVRGRKEMDSTYYGVCFPMLGAATLGTCWRGIGGGTDVAVCSDHSSNEDCWRLLSSAHDSANGLCQLLGHCASCYDRSAGLHASRRSIW